MVAAAAVEELHACLQEAVHLALMFTPKHHARSLLHNNFWRHSLLCVLGLFVPFYH